MTVDQFVDKVRAAGFKVITSGSEYRAQCPAHNGKDLNLAIGQGDNGGIVCTCHSHGCKAEEVARAVGVPMRELMPAVTNGASLEPRVVERYRYERANGELAFEVWRFEPKDFRPYHLGLSGEWEKGYGTDDRPLYRLPELLKADPKEPVFICAGEKDARNLMRLGLVATTNPGGESVKWGRRPEWLEPLKGRRCIVLEDFDPVNPKTGKRPGEEHAKEVYAALTDAGIHAKRLRLPGLIEGEDPSNWILKGGTAEALREIVRPEVHFKLYTVEEMLQFPEPRMQVGDLWEVGGVVMVYGEGTSGKTFLVVDVGMHMVRCLAWHGRDLIGGPVIYINADGGIPFRNRPQAWMHEYPDVEPVYPFLIYNDRIDMRERGRFQAFVDEQQQLAQVPALIVLDTFHRMMPGADENDAKDCGLFFDTLASVRRDLGATALFVHHSNKADTGHRGHSSLRDDSDTCIEVRRSESGLRLVRCDKQRNAVEFPEFWFDLRPVLDSCVIEMAESPPADEQSTERRRGPRAGEEEHIQSALREIIEAVEIDQADLAEKLGLSVPRISYYCRVLRQRGLVTTRQGMAQGPGRRPVLYSARPELRK